MTDDVAAKNRLAAAEEREPSKERLEREHSELIEELRALIPGAEVLFGFLVAVRFTEQFRELSKAQACVYYAALAGTAAALVLFIAPAAHHRVGFREGDKEYVVCKGNREAIAGSIALGLAFTAALHLVTDLVFDAVVAAIASGALFALIVWRWWALALYRNRLRNQPSGPMSAGATRAGELDDREIQAHGAHFRRAWPGRPDPAGPGDSGA